MNTTKLHNPKNARLALQVALAFVFLYAAYSSWTKPDDWTIYVPTFMVGSLSALTVLKLLAAYELVLGLWLLSGRYLKYAALLSLLTLAGIVVLTPSQFLTTFRDVGLALAAVALLFLS
jgi:uncharacterized membrane protein YphA (DoxX/SURF4 family)